jgi:GNAT superfamily N-acetyltransferase
MIFHRNGGVVSDRGDCVVVETPDNPTFYFGNLIHFSAPPTDDDVRRWPARFAEAFAGRPEVRHVTLSWDGPIGAAEAFVPLGYRLERSVVLSATAVHRPPKCDDGAEVRALATAADFEQALDNQVEARDARFAKEPYTRYASGRMARWRGMAAAGLGAWHGAFLAGRLVADCGLFFDDAAGVGRFQAVSTHPDFRRRGLCGRLVWEVARAGLQRVPTLVMVADDEYHAARIYESVGFERAEVSFALCLEPEAGR